MKVSGTARRVGARSHAAVPCPRLKSIDIVVWIVVRKVYSEFRAMPNALWSRKEHGHPLATLSLDWYYRLPPRTPILRPSDTEYLQKLASSLEQVMCKSVNQPKWPYVIHAMACSVNVEAK